MALSALKPCAHGGCGQLVRLTRFCEAHAQVDAQRRQAADRQRGSSAQRGYGGAWRKARAGFLRSHPLCAECARNNVVTAATDVDHIVPHGGDQALFWDHGNWQALCHPCHSRKTATEDGGYGHARTLGAG